MNSENYEVIYFPKPGEENSKATMEAARRRAETLGIRNILVSSTTGKTGLMAAEVFKGYNLLVVSHSTGFNAPDTQEMEPEARKKIESLGVKTLTCQHAFGGVGRAIRKEFSTYQVDEIIAHTLKRFGEGTKVAIEISIMAADAGLIRTDREVIAIGGTSKGVDTALILKPANAQDFFNLEIREVICKPRILV